MGGGGGREGEEGGGGRVGGGRGGGRGGRGRGRGGRGGGVGRGGEGGGGGRGGSWNISLRLPSGTGSTDLRMSCVTVTVLCGFSFTNHGPQILKSSACASAQPPTRDCTYRYLLIMVCYGGIIIHIRLPVSFWQ